MTSRAPFDPSQIDRPAPVLMNYYFLASFVAGPIFIVPLILSYAKYRTLRYRFDEEGVSMRWGVLFHQEVNLTYRRIQDIHLTSNIVQRWMGLASVAIQTASGSSSPEMTIEGILEARELRDYLYAKMRGAKGLAKTGSDSGGPETAASVGEPLAILLEIRDLLKELAGQRGGGAGG